MKKFIYGLAIVILILIVGILIYRSSKDKTSADKPNTAAATNTEAQPASLVVGDLAMKDAVATIYYGNGCPHCTTVEKWLQESEYLPDGSKIDQASVDSWISNAKVKFNMKEVWYNSTNSAELTANATKLGITSDKVGVPFLYDPINNKSYVGETDIKTFFASQTK
ncbi:MAG: hypothetical protein WCG99_00630 [Candidatus Berkelbacteria bacterium]